MFCFWFQIFDDEFKPLQQSGFELVTKIPQFYKYKVTLHRQRREAQGIQAEPNRRDEVELDPESLKMADGNNFLLADDCDGERILIFASSTAKTGLKEHKNIFMDGTFKSVSKQFAQLYTIHVDLGSTEEETNVTPVVFALLPDKRKSTYIRLFNAILRVIPEWAPETVNADFEAAVIEAINTVFPAAEFHGCFFHFSQSLWRKVQNLGLANEYNTSQEVRESVRMCAALAFLKPTEVEEGWLHIHSVAVANEKLNEFFYYFIEQWLENPHLPIKAWNCTGRRHRTNNVVEGWNHRLNTIVGKPHPRIKNLIMTLKDEAENSDMKFTKIDLNLEGVKRKKKYIVMDNLIVRATETLAKSGDIKTFLRNVSYIIKMD